MRIQSQASQFRVLGTQAFINKSQGSAADSVGIIYCALGALDVVGSGESEECQV